MSHLDHLTTDALEYDWSSVDDFPAGTSETDARAVLARISAIDADVEEVRRVTFTPASQVTVSRPEWVWRNRIPARGVTLFAGQEGQGKTVFSAWLTARLTHGSLEGDRVGRACDVVYVGNEDDRGSVLVPRLMAAGADLDRVLFVDLPTGTNFDVGRDTLALSAALDDRTVGLVVIDPLDAHLGAATDTHRKAEVQATIGYLAQLAQHHDCAVLGIAHLNKGESRDVLRKIVGSVGFTTSVRSVLAVGEHPDEPRDRLCVLRKANQTDASAVPALRFRVESATIDDPTIGEIGTARVAILGEEEGHDANVILSVPDGDERTARDEALEWLTDVLADGPLPSRDVKRMAREADIAVRTLQRARKSLGIIVTEDATTKGKPTSWSLPGGGDQ